MIAVSAPPRPADARPGHSRPLPLVLRPAMLALVLVVSWAASSLSLHVFAVFGVVPAAELLALACLGGLPLVPRLGWRPAPAERLIVQSAAAAATLGATLGLALPFGVVAAVGRSDLGLPLLIGATLIGALGLVSLLWRFDSCLLPASADWPGARAAADPNRSGLTGSWRALSLMVGVIVAQLGGSTLLPPAASGFGLAFLGSGFGIGLLGVGLILRPSLPYFLQTDLEALHVPHGLLIGAGLAALTQAGLGIAVEPVRALVGALPRTRANQPRRPLRSGRLAVSALASAERSRLRLVLGATGVLVLTFPVGLVTSGAAHRVDELSPPVLLGLGLLAALLALAFQLFSGLAASRLGWVPTLGGGLVILAMGRGLELAPLVALVLAALAIAGGPLAAELGTQLKAARLLGLADLAVQQVVASVLGLLVALAVVGAGFAGYVERDHLPPVAETLAVAAERFALSDGLLPVAPWLLAGALLQWLGGPGRQAGLLFATGLLVDAPAAGWALLAGLAVRVALSTLSAGRLDRSLALFGLGCIGGEMLRTSLGL